MCGRELGNGWVRGHRRAIAAATCKLFGPGTRNPSFLFYPKHTLDNKSLPLSFPLMDHAGHSDPRADDAMHDAKRKRLAQACDVCRRKKVRAFQPQEPCCQHSIDSFLIYR